MRADTHVQTVHRMAVDVATYDQQSCLAPQTIFVERGGAISPAQTAELLARELDSQQRKYPRSAPSDEESLAIRRARSETEMKALFMAAPAPDGSTAQSDPQAPFVIESPQGTSWTVLYFPNTDSLTSLATPLNRTINLVAVDQLENALPALKPYRAWLQTCAIAASSSRLFTLAQHVGEYGIDRICPVGEMNRAKSGWHHDGGFNILDLVRAVDIERNTDRYSDTFDIDYE